MAIKFTEYSKLYAKNRKVWESNIVDKVKKFANINAQSTHFRDRLLVTDYAYYVSHFIQNAENKDLSAEECDRLRNEASKVAGLQVPLVASQVDTIVGVLGQVLTSSPAVFPVVGMPGQEEIAIQLETLNEYFARLGKWQTNLLKCIIDATKYNVCMVEPVWDTIALTAQGVTEEKVVFSQETLGYLGLKWVDMYHAFWDTLYNPNELSRNGEYHGYSKLYRPLIQKQKYKLWEKSGLLQPGVTDIDWLREKPDYMSEANALYWQERPQVNFTRSDVQRNAANVTWEQYVTQDLPGNYTPTESQMGSVLETTVYLRLDTDEVGLPVVADDVPITVWRVVLHDMKHVVRLEPILSMDDSLGIITSQLKDDGFGWQTKSVAQTVLPMQDAATNSLNTRFASNKRLADELIAFNPAYIDEDSVNNSARVPRIKMNQKGNVDLNQVKLSDVLMQLQQNPQAAQMLLQDIGIIDDYAKTALGTNNFRQGQITPGNRSATEFSGIMSHSDLRTTLYLLPLVYHFMEPIKSQAKILTLQNAHKLPTTKKLINSQTNQEIEVSREQIIKLLTDYKYADGFMPKELLANASGVQFIFNLLSTAPHLFQEYNISSLLEYLAHVLGVPSLAQFKLPPGQTNPALAEDPAATGPAPPRNTANSQPPST